MRTKAITRRRMTWFQPALCNSGAFLSEGPNATIQIQCKALARAHLCRWGWAVFRRGSTGHWWCTQGTCATKQDKDSCAEASGAGEWPVVLVPVGVDLEDLHGTEIPEDQDLLPHLPTYLKALAPQAHKNGHQFRPQLGGASNHEQCRDACQASARN